MALKDTSKKKVDSSDDLDLELDLVKTPKEGEKGLSEESGDSALEALKKQMAEVQAENERIAAENEKLKEGSTGESISLAKVEELIASRIEAIVHSGPSEKAVISETQKSLRDAVNDLLETPIYFFAHTSNYGTIGYTAKNGQSVLAPGKVSFDKYLRYEAKNRVNRSKTARMVSISRFATQSKEMVEFLKGHPEFGITFFMTPKKAHVEDARLSDVMAKFSNQVRGLSDAAVISRIKAFGIPMHEDLAELRKDLIDRYAKDEIKLYDKRYEEKAIAYAGDKAEEVSVDNSLQTQSLGDSTYL
jgi:regulator of replication initiation timing